MVFELARVRINGVWITEDLLYIYSKLHNIYIYIYIFHARYLNNSNFRYQGFGAEIGTVEPLLLASERDTYRGNTIENRGCLFIYLFVYMYGCTYVILYFDPRVFVLVIWSTPSQIALNRILWFIDQYPYHPRN